MSFISKWSGAFRAPRRMMDWLDERLAGARFKTAAGSIAVLTLRTWASPNNIGKAAAGEIVLSRLDLAKILGLTEWQVRQGIEALVSIGFLDRLGTAGAARRTEEGIRRPPRLYRLAAWIVGYFRRLHERRGASPVSNATRADRGFLKREGRTSTPERLLTGEGSKISPPTPVRCRPADDAPDLMAALARLGLAIRLDT